MVALVQVDVRAGGQVVSVPEGLIVTLLLEHVEAILPVSSGRLDRLKRSLSRFVPGWDVEV